MTFPMLCTAAAASASMSAGRAAPSHARQITRAAPRPTRIRPSRLANTGSPARFLNAKG